MGAGLGALVGLATGGLAGYAQQKAQQKQQANAMWQQFAQQQTGQILQQHPDAFLAMMQHPEGKKFIEGAFGKEHTDMLGGLANMNLQAMQQQAAAMPKYEQPKDINGMKDLLGKYEKALDDPSLDAEHKKLLGEHIKDLQGQISQSQKQADTEQLRTQQQQFHQDTLAQREQSMQMMNALHQDTLAMQQQQRDFMNQMAKERSDDQRRAHFQSASQNLASQTANIAKMLTSATPADPKTVKTLLDQRNAAAKTLKQQADKYGLDYDAEQFKPLTVEQVLNHPSLNAWTGGYLGTGTTPSLGAAPEEGAFDASKYMKK